MPLACRWSQAVLACTLWKTTATALVMAASHVHLAGLDGAHSGWSVPMLTSVCFETTFTGHQKECSCPRGIQGHL